MKTRRDLSPVIWLAATLGQAAHGQISFDGSYGSSGAVAPAGNTFRIDSNPEGISDGNLFHGFSEFSIPSGMVADFESPTTIQRIIARVTGGDVSEINGTLRTSGSDADFFLINPSGIRFGEGAQIDVRGAFTASTAGSLTDGDGDTHPMSASGSVLFSAPIEAYGFLGATPGGDIAVDGAGLRNPGGHLQLVGRNVSLSQADLSTSHDMNVRAVGGMDSSIPADPRTETSGGNGGRISMIGTRLKSGSGSHRIAMIGREVDISSSTLNFDGFDQIADGSIWISAAGRLDVTTGSVLGSVQNTGTGASSIDIRSMGSIAVDDSLIVSLTRNSGTGSGVRVEASDLVVEGNGRFDLKGILSLAETNATGGAVDVDVSGSLRISNNGLVGSVSFNNSVGGGVTAEAGNIGITGPSPDNASAGFLTGIIGLSYDGSRGGDLAVEAGEISLHRGGLIDSSSFGTGDGGDIQVRARTILADRAGSRFLTGIGSDTEIHGTGGSVSVFADEITLLGGGLISSSTSGAGDAGSLLVTADRFSASGRGMDSALVAATHSGLAAVTANKGAVPSGDGGSIVVRAGDFRLTDQAGVSTRSEGGGVAGNIDIAAQDFRMESDARISVEGLFAEGGTASLEGTRSFDISDSVIEARSATVGGELLIRSGGLVLLRDSEVSADAGGSGGNISFSDARHLILNRTPVSASAVDRDGGNIFVNTGTFFASASPLSVTSERGAPGTVEIRTLDTLGGGRETEEEELLNPDDILQPDCALRNPDVGGSFTKGGMGGTRRLPGGYLPSFRIIE